MRLRLESRHGRCVYACLVAAVLLAGCSDDPTRPPVTYRLERVSGSGQTDTVGALLPEPLVLRVRTSTNLPAAGRAVTLLASPGSGDLSAQTAVTDAAGLVQVRWTLGTAEGEASVTATLDGSVSERVTFSATVTAPPLRAIAIAAGYQHACAVGTDHRMYCWGLNDHGQLGDATNPGRNYAAAVPGTLFFDRVAAGEYHTCGVTTDRDMYCWGRNNWGQIGDGTTETRLSPVPVATQIEFADVVTGAEYTCGLSVTGSVHCWGFMLDTHALNAWTPRQVSDAARFRSLGANAYRTCGMATDDSAYCLDPTWTLDETGGGEGYFWRPRPAPAPMLASFSGGLAFMCGLDAAGVAWCSGDNSYGQLGIGTTQGRPGVGPVSGGQTFRGLYAGYDWACGVTTLGATYCWGHNMWGAQGPVGAQPYIEPSPHLLPVPAGVTFTAMDGGFYHMCGIAADNRSYCWGGGFSGQLGDGVAVTEFYHRALPAPVIRR